MKQIVFILQIAIGISLIELNPDHFIAEIVSDTAGALLLAFFSAFKK